MKHQQVWFKTSEAAAYLNVSLVSFKSVMHRNSIVAVKTSKNGDFRWHRSQLDAFRIYNTSKPTIKQKLKLKVLNLIF
jgi:hypothetical protein